MQTLDNLATNVHNAVVHHPHVDLRRMHFRTDGDNVTIIGTVQSFFEKQMAQEALRHVEGVNRIENCLEVVWS